MREYIKSEKYQTYLKERRSINNDYTKKYRKSKEESYYSVYLLPAHNYVGVTKNVYARMFAHRANSKRDTTGYTILGTFIDRDDALRLETEYHSNGYDGKHKNNVGIRL